MLDLASGTGRLGRYLRHGHGAEGGDYRVVALDYSWPMVQRTRLALASPYPDCPAGEATAGAGSVVQGDAVRLPFAAGSLHGVAALRFAFHWRDLGPLLAELARVAAPSAPLVLDTYVWSPRAVVAIDAARWGGRVFTHRPAEVRAQAARAGLTVEAEEHAFLCSPYLYRLLPLPAMHVLERVERAVPTAWLCRVFWRFRR